MKSMNLLLLLLYLYTLQDSEVATWGISKALLAFYRLVGVVYFKKNFASFKPMKTPFEVYKSVPSDQYTDDHSHHEKFLGIVREATWSRKTYLERTSFCYRT